MVRLTVVMCVCLCVVGTKAVKKFKLPEAMSLKDYEDNWLDVTRISKLYMVGPGRITFDAKQMQTYSHKLENGSYTGRLTGELTIGYRQLLPMTICVVHDFGFNNLVENKAIMKTPEGVMMLASDDPSRYIWTVLCADFNFGAKKCTKEKLLISFDVKPGDTSFDKVDYWRLPGFKKLGLSPKEPGVGMFTDDTSEKCKLYG